MGKILWTDYIVANNPEGVNRVLQKYQGLPAFTDNERMQAVEWLLDEHGHEASVDLIKEHPDYGVIIDTWKEEEYYNSFDNYRNGIGDISENNQVPVQPVQPCPHMQMMASNQSFHNTLKDVVLIVMAFWLIKTIVKNA